MFIRTVTLIKLVTLAGLALSPTFFDHVENPKVLTGPTVLAGSGSYSFTLESTGDVPANTTYSVTNSHPGWFLMPTNVTIPSGQH